MSLYRLANCAHIGVREETLEGVAGHQHQVEAAAQTYGSRISLHPSD